MENKRIIDNRFEIIRTLGEGGTAKVYLAFDHNSEQNIALKVLKSDLVTEQKIRYFNREAQAISMLDNPNVIKIYDWGHDVQNNVHFIAQEYVEGMTIKEYLKLSTNLAVTEVVSLIEKILDGLSHAHQNGVIHKDVKGQNIMIDADKNVKITDFGIADILEDEMTKTQSLMGTPQYVAPETLNRGISNAQTDIYSVGILMYELLCGQAPFNGDKPTIIMMKQINQPLPSIKMQRSDVPQSVENVVIKATAKRLENRYETCTDMLFDLATVFEPYNEDVPKLILEDDLLDSDEVEQTIQIESTLRLKNIKKDIDKNNKSLDQRRKILVGALIVIPIIILAIFLLKPENYTMPDLIGKDEQTSIDALKSSGVEEDFISVKYETSETIPEGMIISTDPVKDVVLTENQLITLTVSLGQELTELPDYTGQSADVATASIEALGFTVQKINEYNEAEKGTIFKQTPEAGSEVEDGATITIYISDGVAPIEISNLIGMTKNQAKAFADENGLVANFSTECNDSVKKNYVISQNPSSGALLNSGSTIDFTISTGACKTETPTTSETKTEETTASEDDKSETAAA